MKKWYSIIVELEHMLISLHVVKNKRLRPVGTCLVPILCLFHIILCVNHAIFIGLRPHRSRRRMIFSISCGFGILSLSCGQFMPPVEAKVVEEEIFPRTTWWISFSDPNEYEYTPLTYTSDTWYDSTYWSGQGWTRIGRNWMHPESSTTPVRTFLVADPGNVVISGKMFKAHLSQDSDGVRGRILLNNKEIWSSEIGGEDAIDRAAIHHISIQVKKGDRIAFLVEKRDSISCDTTYWDPEIIYPDGRKFVASEAFDACVQGHDGWYYEMRSAEENTSFDRIEVASFYRNGLLDLQDLTTKFAYIFDSSEKLPYLLLYTKNSKRIALIKFAQNISYKLSIRRHGAKECSLEIISPESIDKNAQEISVQMIPGTWTDGIGRIDQWYGKSPDQLLSEDLQTSMSIQREWLFEDGLLGGNRQQFLEAAKSHLERIPVLADDLQKDDTAVSEIRRKKIPEFVQKVEVFRKELEPETHSFMEIHHLWYRIRTLKRNLILQSLFSENEKLMFCKRVPTSYSHLVMQYFGWRARPGGGLFILETPGKSLKARDIFDGHFSSGNVLEPRLSPDGQKLVFSYVELNGKTPTPESVERYEDKAFYHIYSANIDGTNLHQLTSGPYDDLMPEWLPDSGIVFSSTRRKGYARCFGAQFGDRWHVYTLHRMDYNGSNIQTLSFHDTNEWFPTITHSGTILYSRWDYIDRDAVTHQNLWTTRPDGTMPTALWGNATSSPHCAFQAKAIPNSEKYIFTASAHHSITGGSIVIVDPTIAVDGHQALTRITPEIPFPEAESMDIREYYESPYPLSENQFIVSYSPTPLCWEPVANDRSALGIYTLDRRGNRELLYRDPSIGATSAIPIRERSNPPIFASEFQEDRSKKGTVYLANVYQGLDRFGLANDGEKSSNDEDEGVEIKQLRIVQLFPKTTVVADQPPIGMAGEENGRAILGTVPVESDGSAFFTIPAQKPLLFQALDEDGMAYQTMRTLTYLQPGEKVSCIGCHENRRQTSSESFQQTLASGRSPSPLDPGVLGGRPFSYMEMVQPIFDKNCVSCHSSDSTEEDRSDIDLTGTPEGSFCRSYISLCGDTNFYGAGTNQESAATALVPRFGARNQIQVTPPGGQFGARKSRLINMFTGNKKHYDISLRDEEIRVLSAWIDLNAIFYGVNDPKLQQKMLRGDIIEMPEIQ